MGSIIVVTLGFTSVVSNVSSLCTEATAMHHDLVTLSFTGLVVAIPLIVWSSMANFRVQMGSGGSVASSACGYIPSQKLQESAEYLVSLLLQLEGMCKSLPRNEVSACFLPNICVSVFISHRCALSWHTHTPMHQEILPAKMPILFEISPVFFEQQNWANKHPCHGQ